MNNRGRARGSPRGGGFSANRGQGRGNRRSGHPPYRHSHVWRPCGTKDTVSQVESVKEGHNSTESVGVDLKDLKCSVASDSSHEGGLHTYWQVLRPSGAKDAVSQVESVKEGHISTESVGVNSKDLKGSVASDSSHEGGLPSLSTHRKVWRPSGTKDTISQVESVKEGHNSNESVGINSKDLKCSVPSDSSHEMGLPSFSTMSHSGNLHMEIKRMHIRETSNEMTEDNGTSLPSKSEADDGPFPIKSPVITTDHRKPELSDHSPFDLCPAKSGSSVTLKAPLLVQNRERRNEVKRSMEQKNDSVLQPGMVLLKGYLSLSDQINIVKLCRDLGLGPGGFYQPGYRDGAKLNLKMMCLGKNWDPETSKYGDVRPIDGAKPPGIPGELFLLVRSAIKESHALIRTDSKASNPEAILPWMSPDICLVNFYSSTGRLGLHQDRDESERSLCQRLPVVSFSIGDTAEFLYGDQRDVERAHKVLLESGDVLIFGGSSRHVFHGVASIQPNTASKTLLERTNLRPGRLNLTFRRY